MANSYIYQNQLTPQSNTGKALIVPDALADVFPLISGEGIAVGSGGTGALDPFAALSDITIVGTQTLTLAAPTTQPIGFRKRIKVISATNTPAATLTISGPETATGMVCAATWFMDTVAQEIELEVTSNTLWRARLVNRAGTSGADGVVVGTTVLTGKNLWKTYCLSVTGTVHSTTTKGLPDGSAVGERMYVCVTTAATIPVGDISGKYTVNGAAKTSMANIDATTEMVAFEWDGAGWALMSSTVTGGHPTFA